MLWTIMPEDVIMEGFDQVKTAKEYTYRQRRILGYPMEDGRVCIMQIISSDPKDYLDPHFQPGTIVDCRKW